MQLIFAKYLHLYFLHFFELDIHTYILYMYIVHVFSRRMQQKTLSELAMTKKVKNIYFCMNIDYKDMYVYLTHNSTLQILLTPPPLEYRRSLSVSAAMLLQQQLQTGIRHLMA